MVLSELGYSVRSLLKNPIVTLVCLLTLAIGIGATAAVFSLINSTLLKPLPFPNASQLMAVVQQDSRNRRQTSMSMPDFLGYREGLTDLDYLAAYEITTFSLSAGGPPKEYRGALVTSDFFSTLSVSSMVGRTFRKDDTDGTLVISQSLWRNHFQSDPATIGRPVQLNGQTGVIVGVVSSAFWFPDPRSQVWRLVTPDFPLLKIGEDYHFLHAFGRLRPTAAVQHTQAQADVISHRFAQTKPDLNATLTVSIVPLARSWLQNARPLLMTLIAAVGSILLIAFANITNLQLSRIILRKGEFAIRVALGAGRVQLARLLLTENLTLTMVGGALGLGLAFLGTNLLLKMSPMPIPFSADVVWDSRVVLLVLLICAVAGLLLSLVSILQMGSRGILQGLNEARRGLTMSRGSRLFQKCLVVIEVAAAYSLLVAVILMIQSFHRLSTVDVGFDTQNLLIITFRLPAQSYRDQPGIVAFQRRIKEQISSIGGVRSVSASSDIPLVSGFANYFLIKGQPEPPPSKLELVGQASVSPHFFHNMGIAVRAGREFEETDRSGGALVAIVNESMAKQFWGGTGPIGSQVRHGLSSEPTHWYTIVGVVQDTRIVMNLAPLPKLYTPFAQIPQDYDDLLARPLTMEVRTSNRNESVVSAVRDVINNADPTVGFDLRSIDDVMDESVSQSKVRSQLFAFFGGIALWLSVFGIYGVVSNITISDTKAFGIRLALGATRASILTHIIGRGLVVVGAGISIGLVFSLGLGKLLRSFLFEAQTIDLALFAGAAAILILASLFALYLPGRYAAKLDPAVTLKES
jgi:putative ABC transport system permease protein